MSCFRAYCKFQMVSKFAKFHRSRIYQFSCRDIYIFFCESFNSYERQGKNRSEQGPRVPSHRSLLSVNEDDEGRAKHSYERF
jgi:hypothetical protein